MGEKTENNINFASSSQNSNSGKPTFDFKSINEGGILRWRYPLNIQVSDNENNSNNSVENWTTSDREEFSGEWRDAVKHIVENKLEDQVKPFEQILDFYYTVHLFVTKDWDHDIRWIKGANYLIEGLEYGLGSADLLADFQDTRDAMADLNLKICNYAITQFYELMYGDYKDDPRKGKEAYEFDRDFVLVEQRDIAFEIYETADSDVRQEIHNFFNGEGFWGTLGKWFTGLNIPIFPDILFDESDEYSEVYGHDITANVDDYYDKDGEIPNWTMESHKQEPNEESADSEYGKEARIQVPILMLYPDSYIEDCEFLKDAPLVKNLEKRVRYDQPWAIRLEYRRANEAISENFRESFVSYIKHNE